MNGISSRPFGRQLGLFQERITSFNERVPPVAWCSNERNGAYPVKRRRKKALKYANVQPNGSYIGALVFDVDREEGDPRGPARYAFEDADLPAPNFVITNRETLNCHLLYQLEVPVKQFDYGESKALRFARRVQLGMTRRMSADWAYAGLTVKNPNRSDIWQVEQLDDYATDLDYLAQHLSKDDMQLRKLTKEESEHQLGRNCKLFDTVRNHAYRRYRELGYPSFDEFFEDIHQRTGIQNTMFPTPLPACEVRSISRSIAKFCVAEFNAETFSEIQSARGQRKGRARREEFLGQVLQLSAQGLSQRKIAKQLGLSQQTISNWLKRPN